MTSLFQAIKKIAEQNPDGFTVRVPELTPLKNGYIVAYRETQNCFGDQGLTKVLKHALEHERIVGGWKNEENEYYYYDSSNVFDNPEDAIRFGIENQQIAIFDLTLQREIRL
jgi:fructokinase